MTDDDIKAALLELALQRGPAKSFCPSEAARSLATDWRPLMDDIRRVAAAMPEIMATQKGNPVDPNTAKGPIRLHLPK